MKEFSANSKLSSVLLIGIAAITLVITYTWQRVQTSSIIPAVPDPLESMRPNLKAATILNADVAWLINIKSGDLLRTNDGGQHWLRTPGDSVGGRFFAAYFNNEKQGWAVGSGGAIWHSPDSGESWTQISKLEVGDPHQWSFISAEKIEFIGDTIGWIVETFGVWRSEDGGKTWRRVRSVGSDNRGQPVAGVFTTETAAIGFSSGDVHYTSDGSRSWKSVEVIKNGSIRHLDGLDGKFSWVVGYGPPSYTSQISYSDDGGKMWRNSGEIPANDSIYFVQFLNQEEGWAVGATRAGASRGQNEPMGLVLHTTTAGKTWQEQTAPRGENFFEAIHFVDRQHGWLLGRNSFYRTSDGGTSWSIVLKLD